MAAPHDATRRIAEALRVPVWLLGTLIYAGFALLAVGATAHVPALAVVSAVSAVVLLALGLRALLAPSRPFDVGVFASIIDSSRRVGAFYVLAALVWIGVSVAVVVGG